MYKAQASRFSTPGFTIVELIVVITVLAILALAGTFAFGAWRDRVAQNEVKSDLLGVQAAMENALTWNDNGYPTFPQGTVFSDSSVTKNIFVQSKNVTLTYYQGDAKVYCIDAVSTAKPSISMFLDVSSGSKEPKRGTCIGGEGAQPPAPGGVILWTAMSGGGSDVCAIAQTSKLYCSSISNSVGQAGTGDRNATPDLTKVVDSVMFGPVTDVSIGNGYACAVAGGKAYCWGENVNGRLGDGSANGTIQTKPVAVNASVMTGTVTKIQTGNKTTCAIADGNAYCWGTSTLGALGDGSTTSTSTPVKVNTSLMSGVVKDITTSDFVSCAVSDTVYCWGSNGYGQLGNGSGTSSTTPTPISTSGISGAASKVSATESAVCAVIGSKAYCWGSNASKGRLGNGTFSGSDVTTPAPVVATVMSGEVTDIEIRSDNACAVAARKAYCWGQNSLRQLGNNTYTSSNVPVQVDASVMSGNVYSISIPVASNSAASLSQSKIYRWGSIGGTSYGIPTQVDDTYY